MEVNVCTKENINDAMKVLQNKKHGRVILITNGGDDNNLFGKKLIEQAREITHSNFVCLVFQTVIGILNGYAKWKRFFLHLIQMISKNLWHSI